MNTHQNPPIADIAFIRLRGLDAEAFAQSQFMNDVAALAPGQWHWSGWLDAKGRVRALFALARLAPGELLLALLDAEPQAFVEGLKRFLFRSKVVITVDADLQPRADFKPLESAGPADQLRFAADGSIGFDCSGVAAARVLWATPGVTGAVPDAAASARWRAADLAHGLPRWTSGHEHPWTPHMLSLDRLRAFSVRKGCYPGQEIVARTHFLGQTKRQAWWIEGEGLGARQAIGDEAGRPIGEVIEADPAGHGALAVLALAAPGRVRGERGEAVARLPLAGLARPI